MKSIYIFLTISLSSCSLAPKTSLPDSHLPITYLSQQGQQEPLLSQWWEQFQDSLLITFITQACAHNFDLRTCAEYIEQARSAVWSANALLAPKVEASAIAATVNPSKRLQEALTPPAQVKQRESTFNALLQHVQQLFTSGLANLQDVELSRSRLHACKSQTPLLEDALGQNVIQLSFLLGTTPQEILPQLRQEGRIPTGSCKIPVGLPSDLLKHRPDIQAAEHRLDAAGCFIGQAKAQLFPSFSLTGILGGASTLFPNLFTKSNRFWLAYPSGQFPIFQGGSLLANLHNANAEQQLAMIDYEKTVLQAYKEVESALTSYASEQLRSLELLQEGSSQKSLLRQSLLLYETGLVSQESLLDAYERIFAIQERYIAAKEQTMISLIALYKALGGGWDTSSAFLINR